MSRRKREGVPSDRGAVMTCKEIAAVIGCDPKTVENILARAIPKLRTTMNALDPGFAEWDRE